VGGEVGVAVGVGVGAAVARQMSRLRSSSAMAAKPASSLPRRIRPVAPMSRGTRKVAAATENIRVNSCLFVVTCSWRRLRQVKEAANFQIRPARVGDVPVILELIRDLATYERAPTEVVATEEQLLDFLFGPRPAAEVLLAFEGESPIGFALFFHNFSTWLGRPGLYLEDLFVKPEKRGKGHGLALLVELAKIARNRGCGRMEWAVLDWNEPAIKFYRKLGAKPMDEWTVFRLTRDGIAGLANAADTAATTEQVD
jgi:GNAT superfamily N-acetyltransferase